MYAVNKGNTQPMLIAKCKITEEQSKLSKNISINLFKKDYYFLNLCCIQII